MDISGTWYNQLGSKMELKVEGNKITGTYESSVGSAEKSYPLTGYLNEYNPDGIAVGWTVLWNNQYGNQHSLTSWTGQYQLIDGKEEIYSFWLLVSELKQAEDWSATHLGEDTFTRIEPSKDKKLKAMKRGKISHPI